MKIQTKDNILIKSGKYKGKKGQVLKIIKKKTRALVEIFKDEEGIRLIEMDLSNLLLIYRPVSDPFLNANKFKIFKPIFIKMRKMNNKLNDFFSIEEFNHFLKIRSLENIQSY